ncbi:MAG: Cof subfamily protein (haloacid dehalogenase superfamily) [Limisphaerales bacterium]|jgi:Cof subfamily protein (haloacid dehalogenase superfamily)
MNYKAFALDLDGTLLVGEDLPEENIVALKRAKAAGIQIMMATARWSQIAERTAAKMGISDLVIACSGAQVRDPVSNQDIFDRRLPVEFCEELFSICNQERCIATVTFDDDVRVKLDGEPDPDTLAEEMSWVPELIVDPANMPRVAAVQGSGCVAKIRATLEERYRESVNIFDSIGPSGKIIIIITAKAGTKGAALQAACDHLGIERHQVVAFGDAENDVEMFRAAGAAVAMGQSDAATKAEADYVTLANHEAGVAHAVNLILDHGRLPQN